jgi:leucyl aminopeptidase
MLACYAEKTEFAIPVQIVKQSDFSQWLGKQNSFTQNWLTTTQFRQDSGSVTYIPDASGKVVQVLLCVNDMKNFWSAGSLSTALGDGVYKFEGENFDYARFALAWGLGAYQFSRYKKPTKKPARLVLDKEHDAKHINNLVESIYMVRDLINTPTDDMGPTELGESVVALAKKYNATVTQIIGEDLLKQNYASIYTVGRASDDAPRLIDLRWGDSSHPRVTLVGKGVCFDTGGLDIKPTSGMLLMKKDMGGAAHTLGLARMIMEAKLPINLRVLIPAVENSISGNAYRPGDIIKSRKGITIEIGNTDAEGRVVLADALTEAVSEKPDLIIDIATLTGAARVALGTELPGLFCNTDKVAAEILQHAEQENDPIWRLPFFTAYRESLNTPYADINNNSSDAYGGAITAGLFLKEFVPDDIPWVHFDLMAWNLKSKPGRPQGGEAMAIRALFSYLKARYLSIDH